MRLARRWWPPKPTTIRPRPTTSASRNCATRASSARPNWSGEALPAPLREIAAAADPVTRTFLVKADIGADASKGVRLGQTATMLVEMPKTIGINKLPLSALKEEQGRTIVWIVDKASMTV